MRGEERERESLNQSTDQPHQPAKPHQPSPPSPPKPKEEHGDGKTHTHAPRRRLHPHRRRAHADKPPPGHPPPPNALQAHGGPSPLLLDAGPVGQDPPPVALERARGVAVLLQKALGEEAPAVGLDADGGAAGGVVVAVLGGWVE